MNETGSGTRRDTGLSSKPARVTAILGALAVAGTLYLLVAAAPLTPLAASRPNCLARAASAWEPRWSGAARGRLALAAACLRSRPGFCNAPFA